MNSAGDTIRKPFIDHIGELRTRLFWIVLSVTVAAGAAFTVHQQLLSIIQKPLRQTLYFTSPTGGLTFIFQLCVTVGIIVAFPVITYHLYRFLSPLLVRQKRTTIFICIVASFLMACAGVAFAYFISLPAALTFLTQFGGEGIESLIKADEYFSFALAYIAGFAIIFQIPLLVLLINRIKPLGPGGMMRSQRWVILLSFVGAALITPTPDPVNQALMAAPAIVLYQVSILLVMAVNRGRKPKTAALKPASSFPRAINLADSAIKSTLFLASEKVVPHGPSIAATKKIVSDFVSPDQAASRRRQAASAPRPAPRLASDRLRQAQPKSQQTKLLNRPAQSIDGII